MATPVATARALLGRVYRSARSRIVAARMQSVRRAMATAGALAHKVALVTGASSGVGLAIATTFARAGARCILVALDPVAGAHARDLLASQGHQVELEIADVTDAGRVRDLAREVAARHDRIDILVNNAGVFLDEDRAMAASQIDDLIVQRTLAVNLFGAIHACTSFAKLLRRGSRVINITSVMGQLSRRSDGYAPAYRLSKSALNSYTQSLAADFRGRGVMVDCMHPGWVKTAIGGPQAEIEPEESVFTAFYLAMREPSDETGLFWWDCDTIRW
jgi:NAD(P)-dependent dehydrogenase (short-subunit alcohol dehydrogenase family)